jgi:hypothetical protein
VQDNPARGVFFARIRHTIDKDFTRDRVGQELSMGSRIFTFLFLLACLQASFAESGDPQRPLSIYIVRTGEQLQAPHVLTYRMFEYAQMRGRWIFPDVGYYDSGHANDALWFAGAGGEVYRGERITWTQEIYAAQEAGSAAHNQRSLWLWPVLDLRLTPRLTAQAVAYPTVPLDRAAQWGFSVDRAKLEYAVRPHFQAGAGYSSSKCAGNPWQNKPFVTSTVINRTGAWEFWMQRIPGGAQIQLRYQLMRRGF